MNQNANPPGTQTHRGSTTRWRTPILLLAVSATTIIATADAATDSNSAATIEKREPVAQTDQNSSAEKSPPAASVSKTSSSDSKSGTTDPQSLPGCGGSEVEALLGKPTGKLQTGQGVLWLYAEWRVQFDHSDKVLKVEKDQPVRLAKVDPQFLAAADAVARAAVVRAAADDAARIKAALPPVEDIRVVSNGGERVDLPSLLAEDKITIVDFYAPWCGPCRQMSPQLERLAKEDPDVVLLKVDIVNWETPVTQQFGIRSIPDVRVFNRSKAQVGEGTPDLSLVLERIKEAKGS